MPGVQKPHWSAAWRVKASSSRANSGRSASPSIVSHLAALGVGREEAAGADRAPVDEHRAGAADLDVAGALRAGEPELVAQDVEQQLLRLDLADDGAPLTLSSSLTPAPSVARAHAAPHATPPSTRRRSASLVLLGAQSARRRSARDRAASSPSVAAIAWSRTARSSVTAREHGPADVLADDDDAVVAQQDGPAVAERLARRRAPCVRVGDQLGVSSKTRDAVGEEDRVVGQQLELRPSSRRARSRRAGGRGRPRRRRAARGRPRCGGPSRGAGASPSGSSRSTDDVLGSTSSSATPLRLIQIVSPPAGRGADVARASGRRSPPAARMRQAQATCSRSRLRASRDRLPSLGAPSAGSRGGGSRRP